MPGPLEAGKQVEYDRKDDHSVIVGCWCGTVDLITDNDTCSVFYRVLCVLLAVVWGD